MDLASTLRTLALLATSFAACNSCPAAPEEIQVYLDDLSAPGQFGVDVHSSYVLSGSKTPGYLGETPPHRLLRLTPEFYYGISPSVELGLYLLTSRSADGNTRLDGSKLRLKYIAPHDEKAGAFWGLNLEVGRTAIQVSQTPWNAQLKGIVGLRSGSWTLGANTNLDWSLSKGGGPVAVSLDLKVAREVREHSQLGFELYSELGPLRRIQALNRNAKTLFAVLDQELGGDIDLNLGLGRGLTDDADRWVVKLVLGTHF